LRDTDYATELREPGIIHWSDGSEGRIERLLIKGSQEEEVRFSWWKDGRFQTRPLDLGEEDLLSLMADAINHGVFTQDFLAGLRRLLQ
jgi:hypothetical protein